MNAKKIVSMVLALSMVVSATACDDENKSSSEMVDSLISSHEEISSNNDSITASEVDSNLPIDSKDEQSDEYEFMETVKCRFEIPSNMADRSGIAGVVYEMYVDSGDWKDDLVYIVSYNHKYPEQDYSLTDTTNWVEKSKEFVMADLEQGSEYDLTKDGMIIDSQEEVTINQQKFIKFKGYFTMFGENGDKVKFPLIGYITVYQMENCVENFENYGKPNFCSFIATMPEDKSDMDKMEEVVDHAAETLEFLK